MFRELLIDSIKYLFSKSAVAILNLFSIYLINHIYGASEYGKFSIIFLLCTSITSLTTTWFTQSYLRANHDDLNKDDGNLGSYIYLALLINIFICFFVVKINSTYNIWCMLILSQSLTFYMVGRVVLQKSRAIWRFFYYDCIRVISLIIFLFFFSKKDAGVINIVIGFSIGGFFFIYPILSKSALKLNFNSVDLKRSFRFGFPVALWLMIASLQGAVDRLIVGHYLSDAILGQYSVFYDSILRVSALIVIPISNAFYPLIVKYESKIKSYKKLSKNLSIISVSVAIFSALLSIVLFKILDTYFSYNLLFPLRFTIFIVFGIVLWQMALFVHKPLELKNLTLLMLRNLLLSFFLSTIINLLYITDFGIELLPISLSISAICYLCLTHLSVIKNDR